MSRFTDALRSLTAMAGGGGPREAGPPGSTNGASSFHVMWELASATRESRLVEVSALLEILVPPRVSALYFWALQVDFLSEGRLRGGAHTGLQWNRRYPGNKAVNWGGYASPEDGGTILPGSASTLPGFTDDPHTLAYPWQPDRPYRLRVFRPPDRPGAWRAEVTDEAAGQTSVIRDLYVDAEREAGNDPRGHYLARPLVWSEVFADCDAPSVTVRWSELEVVDEAGSRSRPDRVRVNYQAALDGGCGNTTTAVDGQGILQVTNTLRTAPQDAVLVVEP
jgi:hypothetical protein